MDCRVKPGNDGGEARGPGPITTALTIRIRHGVWVPAFAGTTAVKRSRFPSPLAGEGGECGAIASTSRVRGYGFS